MRELNSQDLPAFLASQKNALEHYFMVTGQIVFRAPDAEEDTAPNSILVNAVITSPDGRIAVQQLGRAQQALQLQFFKKMGEAQLTVLDVVIMALMPLGVFTAAAFHAVPAAKATGEAVNPFSTMPPLGSA